MATATTAPSLTPALPPPAGETSNFEHPVSLTRQMHIAMGVAIPLATMFFFARTYVRIWVKRQWIAEDWLAVIAYIGTISFTAVGAATMAHHGGQHEWDITVPEAREAGYVGSAPVLEIITVISQALIRPFKWFNVASIHYGITICIAKLAILFLYRRVFSPYPGSPFDITAVFLIVLLILFYVATNLTKIWECIPREKIWNASLKGHCINTPMLLNVSGVFNTVTDFIMVLLPARAVWNLNMDSKKKIMVVLAFTFGLCAPAFSLVGTIVRFQGTNNPDKTWVQPEIIMWGLAELTTGILCVSFPEMVVIFKKKAFASREASTSIRKGRYRKDDAVYQGPARHNKFKTSISYGGSTLGDTRLSKADNTGTQLELDEVNLIDGQGAPDSNADGRQENQRWPGSGEVEVTREVRVNSSSIV